jgi:hypothetical protein
MAKQLRKYHPPEPGPLRLRECVRRPLLALAGTGVPDACLAVGLVEDVERTLRCELPDEVLACFANGDDTLAEWGFRLGEVADHTSRARGLGCRSDLIAVAQNPNCDTLFCVERRGLRQRAVRLVELELEANGELAWHDLGAWLAEVAGLEPEVSSRPPRFLQPSLFDDLAPGDEPVSREWRLVE